MWIGSFYIGLQEVLTSVQILFYLVTGTVVILTYNNARKSLLNPVHTAYQKLVINKLKELSEELYSEFEPESPKTLDKKSNPYKANSGRYKRAV